MRNNKTSTHKGCFLKIIIALAIVEIIGIAFSGRHSFLSFAEYRITDFRLPQSSAMDFDIFGGLNSSYRNDYNNITRYTAEGRLGLVFYGFSGTEEKDLYGALRFEFNPQIYKYSNHDSSFKDLSSDIDLYEMLSSYVYINKTNFFGAPAGEGDFLWSYDSYGPNWYSHYLFGSYNTNFLIGYGRMRDGTDAWRAMEIEKILISEGLISTSLSSNEIMELAQTINREREYSIRFDRAEKHYYRAIETTLQSLGVDHVPAYVWFKIRELLEEDVTPRRFGMQLGMGPHAEGYSSYSYDSEDGTSNSSSMGNPRIDLMGSINSAYPLTHRLQFSEAADLYWGENGILYDLYTGFAYLIAIKLEIELATDLKRYVTSNNPTVRELQQAADFNIMYYLEDNMTIGFHNHFYHYWDRDAIYVDSPRNGLSTGIHFSYDVW